VGRSDEVPAKVSCDGTRSPSLWSLGRNLTAKQDAKNLNIQARMVMMSSRDTWISSITGSVKGFPSTYRKCLQQVC
jgi:hypothetical protein